MLLLLTLPAHASDFMDVWVTTAFEDDNVLAGPEASSPSPNFVERGNDTFFENYESKYPDDYSRSNLVLYRRDEGFSDKFFTEAALALRFIPYLDPGNTKTGVLLYDDGSYVRIAYKLKGDEKQTVSLTGYAANADRFRLGYSYDLTWAGTSGFTFDPKAAPGARLQYQNQHFYAFAGIKTAVGDFTDPITGETRNQAYYAGLAGVGGDLGDYVKLEGGAGSFQQGQLLAEATVTSPLYGSLVKAVGACTQLSVRTTPKLDYIVSNELKLYRNTPEGVPDTYIRHRRMDGVGLLLQAEGNMLAHNLLDATAEDSTVIEKAFAGDLQALVVAGTTEIGVDFVYKDLPYIVFNVPGLTSGYALSPEQSTSPQVYGRAKVSQFFEKPRLTPSVGFGLMQPASYQTGAGYYVQLDAANVERVPDGQAPSALLSTVAGMQWDVSRSVVGVAEVLYTIDNNKSDAIEGEDLSYTYTPAPANWRNELGFNLIVRARF